jgi:hypothetical protein
MQTWTNDQAHRHLARAWALLDRAEQLARQAVRDEAGVMSPLTAVPWLALVRLPPQGK